LSIDAGRDARGMPEIPVSSAAAAPRSPVRPLGWLRSGWLVVSLGALSGCSHSETQPAAVPPVSSGAAAPTRAPTQLTGWEAGKWGTFVSQRFDLRIPLPNGRAWRIDDHKGSWLVAAHSASSSSLRLRVFLESHAQNRTKCEARAREAEPGLPTPKVDQAVDDTDVGVIRGWDARAVSFVTPDTAQPQKLTGHLLVFASNIRKCLAIQLTTEAEGSGAQETVAARLVDAKERIVRDISFDHELGTPGRELLTAPGPSAPSR